MFVKGVCDVCPEPTKVMYNGPRGERWESCKEPEHYGEMPWAPIGKARLAAIALPGPPRCARHNSVLPCPQCVMARPAPVTGE